jgi:hypothetical protein
LSPSISHDAPALRETLSAAHPPDRFALVTEIFPDGSEGSTDLQISVDASSKEEAIERAVAVLRAARSAAELPPADTELVGWIAELGRGPSRSEELLADAHALLSDGRADLALIRAQSACEILAKSVFDRLLNARLGAALGDQVRTLLRPSLNDKRTQRVLEAVTGTNPCTEAWWPRYRAQVERRNAVLHDGADVEVEWASAAIGTAREVCLWLDGLAEVAPQSTTFGT